MRAATREVVHCTTVVTNLLAQPGTVWAFAPEAARRAGTALLAGSAGCLSLGLRAVSHRPTGAEGARAEQARRRRRRQRGRQKRRVPCGWRFARRAGLAPENGAPREIQNVINRDFFCARTANSPQLIHLSLNRRNGLLGLWGDGAHLILNCWFA